MELYKEILCKLMERAKVSVTFPDIHIDHNTIETQCYKALQEIKAVIEDDSLSDFDCVEEIVCIFERLGSDGGVRHDFG